MVSPVETAFGSPPEPRLKEQPLYNVYQFLDKVLKQEFKLAQIQIAASNVCLYVIYRTSVHSLLAKTYQKGDPKFGNIEMSILSL